MTLPFLITLCSMMASEIKQAFSISVHFAYCHLSQLIIYCLLAFKDCSKIVSCSFLLFLPNKNRLILQCFFESEKTYFHLYEFVAFKNKSGLFFFTHEHFCIDDCSYWCIGYILVYIIIKEGTNMVFDVIYLAN